MIIFLTTAAHGYTIRRFLECSQSGLRRRVITMSYGEFLSWPTLPAGHYIFADVDRLDAAEAAAVATRIDHLAQALPQASRLNDPRRLLGRLKLLNALHASGSNAFDARLASDSIDGLRYPVFVRPLVEHTAGTTSRLRTPEELEQALQALSASGQSLDRYIVTEYVDVRNAQGHHEVYSLLRVGSHFIATCYATHVDWIVKGEAHEATLGDIAAANLDFVRSNPHAHLLKPVFATAGIDYGRVDYAFSAARLQVFEINSNPFTLATPEYLPDYREAGRHFEAALSAALAAIDAPLAGVGRWLAVAGSRGPACIEAPGPVRRALRRMLKRLDRLEWEHACGAVLSKLKALRGKPPTHA